MSSTNGRSFDTLDELMAWQPPEQKFIIDSGILHPETRLLIFGPAKRAWKSNLALHTAFCLAEGSEWFGFQTTPCLPFIVQTELPKALYKKRVQTYISHRRPLSHRVIFKTIHRLKLDTPWGADVLEKDIALAQARFPNNHIVLILDPLYKLMAGHITDDYDVKKFQDNIDELKDKYKISIILIHHTRLTRLDARGYETDLGAEEMFGSSMFNNWCDTACKISPRTKYDDGKVKLTFELVRHAESILPSLDIQWSRLTLQPTVTARGPIDLDSEEISIRYLE